MRMRTMTTNDIAAGVRLNRVAGWNQSAADWERFLRISPEGCFVAAVDGAVLGTVTTISFEKRFAWVGMVLVEPEHRGKGIGTKLLQAAIDYLDRAGIPTIKLDATPQGKPLYEKSGFVSEFEIERWILGSAKPHVNTAASAGNEEISPAVLESISHADRDVFGADRSCLLASLHDEASEFTMTSRSGSALVGYAFGRHGLFADHMGPWMAQDVSSARQLLEGFVGRSARQTLLVDCLKENTMAVTLLNSIGFTPSRLLTRMYRGPNSHPGIPAKLCAIMGPEFG